MFFFDVRVCAISIEPESVQPYEAESSLASRSATSR
jgi:hypothetical protein